MVKGENPSRYSDEKHCRLTVASFAGQNSLRNVLTFAHSSKDGGEHLAKKKKERF